MSKLINGRTPEDIKRVLVGCSADCKDCPYADYQEDCAGMIERDALLYIEYLEAQQPKWISVEERLPETTDVYLIHAVHRYNKNDGYRCMDVRLFFKDEFAPWQGLPDLYEVTHWMPLPEPPEEASP